MTTTARSSRRRGTLSPTDLEKIRRERYAAMSNDTESASLWSFDSLFPQPVLDEDAVRHDLYYVRERDEIKLRERGYNGTSGKDDGKEKRKASRVDVPVSSFVSPFNETMMSPGIDDILTSVQLTDSRNKDLAPNMTSNLYLSEISSNITNTTLSTQKQVDRTLTRMVEDRVYGYRRTTDGLIDSYSTQSTGDAAVKFRSDGVRIGRPLKVNLDLLTYYGRTLLQRGKIDEAEEYYVLAIQMDPRDGRGHRSVTVLHQTPSILSCKRGFEEGY